MEFFGEAVSTLSILVIALGAGLGVWGLVNLLEGYPYSYKSETQKGTSFS